MARDRELNEPQRNDERYIRRDELGRFTDSQDDAGRSRSQDRQHEAKTKSKKGQGDRDDRGDRGTR